MIIEARLPPPPSINSFYQPSPATAGLTAAIAANMTNEWLEWNHGHDTHHHRMRTPLRGAHLNSSNQSGQFLNNNNNNNNNHQSSVHHKLSAATALGMKPHHLMKSLQKPRGIIPAMGKELSVFTNEYEHGQRVYRTRTSQTCDFMLLFFFSCVCLARALFLFRIMS
jgi:hypothetical protein